MADLIDKQALIEQINIERKMSRTSYPKRSFTVGDTLQCIYDAPTIDPESLIPQGEWIYKKYEDEDIWLYYCSECDTPNANKRNYCSNCGAKMKGAGDNA